MINSRISEAYIHFALIYMIDHIFLVLKIKDLINEDGDLTTLFKLTTGTKPPVSYLRVLFCPCVLRKASAHVDKKALKVFHGIFVGITQHQKEYIFYVPGTRKIISSYDFFL